MAQPSVLQDASWQDRAFISVVDQDTGNWKAFAGLTQEIDLPDFSKDFEGQPVMNGGRVRENSAEEDSEVTLTIYPIGVVSETKDDEGTVTPGARPQGAAEWFLTGDTGEAYSYEPSLQRKDFDVAITWTNVSDSANSTSPVYAHTALDTGTDGFVGGALRWIFRNAQITEFNQDFGDRVHTAEVTFKFSPYDETGSANYENQSTTDTSGNNDETLPAVTATSS